MEVFAKLEEGEKCKPSVTYDCYSRHFNENHKHSFESPKSDTCQTCVSLEN